MRPRQNGRHLIGDLFNFISGYETCCILIQMTLRFVPIGLNNSQSSYREICRLSVDATKWLPFADGVLEFVFLYENWGIPIQICTKFCSQSSNQQYTSIGSDNGMMLNRWQTIIWTIDGLFYWRIYTKPWWVEMMFAFCRYNTPRLKIICFLESNSLIVKHRWRIFVRVICHHGRNRSSSIPSQHSPIQFGH